MRFSRALFQQEVKEAIQQEVKAAIQRDPILANYIARFGSDMQGMCFLVRSNFFFILLFQWVNVKGICP